MKVIVNVDENCIEEQVIINCHELNENIINIQKTISAMENQSLKCKESVCDYKKSDSVKFN